MIGPVEDYADPESTPALRSNPPGETDLRTWIAGIGELAAAVNRQTPLEELLDQIARTACELLGYDYCGVLLANEDRSALRICGSWGLATSYIQLINEEAPLLLTGTGACASPSSSALVGNAPVLIDDIDSDPNFGPWGAAARNQGYRSMVSVPLRNQHHAIGTLNVYSTRPRSLAETGLDLLQVLADHAGIALETSALLERDRMRVIELTELNSSLTHQTALLRRSAAIHDQLIGEALRGGGVASISAVLAELAGRAVLVEDVSGHELASASYSGVSVKVPTWDDRAAQGWHDVISSLSMKPDDERGIGYEHPVPFAGLLLSPVRVAEDIVAIVWLASSPPLESLQLRAIQQAIVVLGLELLRRRSADEAQWQLRGDLVSELVTGVWVDHDAVVARAQRLGLDLHEPHAIVAVRDPEGSNLGELSRVMRALQTFALSLPKPRPLVAAGAGDIVVLVPAPNGADIVGLAGRFRMVATQALAGTIRIAISDPSVDIRQLPGALRQVRALLTLTPYFSAEGVLTVSSTGLVGMLLADVSPSRLRVFAQRWLGPLRTYDAQRSTDLLPTLRAYLTYDLNTAATASALFIHPNTVTLRLKRVESLLGASLNRVDDITQIRTALVIDDIASSIA